MDPITLPGAETLYSNDLDAGGAPIRAKLAINRRRLGYVCALAGLCFAATVLFLDRAKMQFQARRAAEDAAIAAIAVSDPEASFKARELASNSTICYADKRQSEISCRERAQQALRAQAPAAYEYAYLVHSWGEAALTVLVWSIAGFLIGRYVVCQTIELGAGLARACVRWLTGG